MTVQQPIIKTSDGKIRTLGSTDLIPGQIDLTTLTSAGSLLGTNYLIIDQGSGPRIVPLTNLAAFINMAVGTTQMVNVVTPVAGVATIDLALGNNFKLTLPSNTAINFINFPTLPNMAQDITLFLLNTGSFTATFNSTQTKFSKVFGATTGQIPNSLGSGARDVYTGKIYDFGAGYKAYLSGEVDYQV